VLVNHREARRGRTPRAARLDAVEAAQITGLSLAVGADQEGHDLRSEATV
jgi:hypothetical protein